MVQRDVVARDLRGFIGASVGDMKWDSVSRSADEFKWISSRMYRGMSYVHLCMFLTFRISLVRTALINSINFTLYEGIKSKISAWEASIGQ
jgi:hypothetical protein